MRRRKYIRFVLILIICCLLSAWGTAIIHCEILTSRHADALFATVNGHDMIGPIEKLKVLDYNKCGTYAIVYTTNAVNGNRSLLLYDPDTKSWQVARWETIWSVGGSAEDFIWPYFR